MGGFGSRRSNGSGRATVEACRSIDVNQLQKAGCLRAGWWGGWQWTRDGEKVASIMLRNEADRLHLSYRIRMASGEWQDVSKPVRIVRVQVEPRDRQDRIFRNDEGERIVLTEANNCAPWR